jgi:type II restriction enzyme
MDLRGWLLDVLRCVDSIPTDSFTLNQIYAYIDDLQKKHPDNSFIKDKIRQQLQLLRDKGFIEFTSRGNYKKIVL